MRFYLRTMKFSHHKRGGAYGARVAVIVFLVAVLLISADFIGGGAVRSFVRLGAVFIWESAYGAVEVFGGFPNLRTRRLLAEENAGLKREIDKLKFLFLRNEILEKENTALRELVGLSDAYEGGVAARIVSPAQTAASGTFVVSAGASEGVSEGDLVVAAHGVAIGRIADVGERVSSARLLFAPNEKVEGNVAGDAVLISGRGTHTGVFEIPRGADISLGQTVDLSGTPFAAGIIGRVVFSGQDAVWTVYVRPPVDFGSLIFVEIIPLPSL